MIIKNNPHVDYYDVFDNFPSGYGGKFGECYMACDGHSIPFQIPDTLIDFDDCEDWEVDMFNFFLKNGFNCGDTIYIDCNF